MTNSDLCLKVFEFLKHAKVETVVICAGARNAPFVMKLDSEDFNKIYYFEERSAAFYALGLMKQSGKPVAIITTSGTAASELLPATIEAYYQGLPLILITADRPKTYRGSGAPQAIMQTGLFADYVEKTFDWDISTKDFAIETRLQSPMHFNICFDEPLADKLSGFAGVSKIKILEKQFFAKATSSDIQLIKKPLILVGQIEESQKSKVIRFILEMKAPVYLESLSQLRAEKEIQEYVIKSSEHFIKKIFKQKWCESVVRIGSVPTLRFWRDLETDFREIDVINFTDQNFSGIAKSAKNFKLEFCSGVDSKNTHLLKMKESDALLQKQKQDLLNQFPSSEPNFVRLLSEVVTNKPLYLGNSLPIREWDQFANSDFEKQSLYANRGANGIDGQVSTYLGWAARDPVSYCLVGDLTAMYDLASLGLNSDSAAEFQLVVMNNFGGHIFKRVFKDDKFLNTHNIEFASWAKMWNWNYCLIKSVDDFKNISTPAGKSIIELQPDLLQTEMFWQAWDLACSKI